MSNRADATPNTSPPVDVVGLGLNAMDYIAIVPEFPSPETKVEISEVRLEPGGQVATALVTCRRLGLTVRYIGSVGSDDLGRAQLASLVAEGISTSYVRVVPHATTQMAVAIVQEAVGERTILWHRDPRLIYPAGELRHEVITEGRLLHLDGRDSEAALRAARIARGAGIPVMVDIDKRYDETTEGLLETVDYLIAAEEFALGFTGADNTRDAVMALAGRFPQAVVGVTLGPRGAIFAAEGGLVESPAFDVPVRDTTGAGDVFHGAFIFGVLDGWDLETTTRFAHAAAAMKCREPGARTGIPRLEEIQRFLETARPRTRPPRAPRAPDEPRA
jgi:sulfofructose kinase